MNELEFIKDTHTYLFKGRKIPCVSDILNYKFPNTYKGIPEETLKNAASRGTAVHETIDKLIRGETTDHEIQESDLDDYIKFSAHEFLKLQMKWVLVPVSTETAIHFKGVYAGTYDMLTLDGILCDYKTTSKLHVDNETKQARVNLQLSLYYLALESMKRGKYQEYGYAIWLPKGLPGKVEKVLTWDKQDLIELIKEYIMR